MQPVVRYTLILDVTKIILRLIYPVQKIRTFSVFMLITGSQGEKSSLLIVQKLWRSCIYSENEKKNYDGTLYLLMYKFPWIAFKIHLKIWIWKRIPWPRWGIIQQLKYKWFNMRNDTSSTINIGCVNRVRRAHIHARPIFIWCMQQWFFWNNLIERNLGEMSQRDKCDNPCKATLCKASLLSWKRESKRLRLTYNCIPGNYY